MFKYYVNIFLPAAYFHASVAIPVSDINWCQSKPIFWIKQIFDDIPETVCNNESSIFWKNCWYQKILVKTLKCINNNWKWNII